MPLSVRGCSSDMSHGALMVSVVWRWPLYRQGDHSKEEALANED